MQNPSPTPAGSADAGTTPEAKSFRAQVLNFCNSDPLTVLGDSHPRESIGALVTLRCGDGSVVFHHALRPEQARAMAALLLEAATAAEAHEAARNRSGLPE